MGLRKVDEKIYRRILELKGIGLTSEVIATRLGISSRTVRVYTRLARAEAQNVPSCDHTEAS